MTHPYALSHGAAPRMVSKTQEGTLEQLTYTDEDVIRRAFRRLAPFMKPYVDLTTPQLDAYIEILCMGICQSYRGAQAVFDMSRDPYLKVLSKLLNIRRAREQRDDEANDATDS